MPFDPKNPYGNAEWAQYDDLRKAGMLGQNDRSVFLGFHQRHKVFSSVQGGIMSVAAPRSGKFSTQIAWAFMSSTTYKQSIICLDPRGEIAAVTRNQMFDGKPCIYYNPLRMHGLPHMSLNPLDHIDGGSPTVVSDVKEFYEQWHPLSGSSTGRFFELTAKDIAEAITVTLAELHGSVDLPSVHELVNLIEPAPPEYRSFEFDMSCSKHAFIQRVAATLRKHREDKSPSGNGMNGVLSELYLSFSCLNDPVLRASISPPFAFSFADICTKDAPPVNFHLMIPTDKLSIWAPVIKGIFRNAMSHKSRAPDAPPQLWIIDECAQLKRFPLIVTLFTYGAGHNIRPIIFLQSSFQLRDIDQNAEHVILSSCAVQWYFTINDYETAAHISRLAGMETNGVPDLLQQRQSRLETRKVGLEMLAGNVDRERMETYALHKQASTHLNKEASPLILPDQIMQKLNGRAIMIASDLDKPVLLDLKHYYEAREMNGFYHPHPFHPPMDRVKLSGRDHRVIHAPVPPKYAHFPQYKDSGEWSYIHGFKP